MGDVLLGSTHFAPGLGLTAVEIRPALNRSLTSKQGERWALRLRSEPRLRAAVILGRQFTHERLVAASAVSAFEEGLRPLAATGRLGALVMRFSSEFRFCRENRDHLIALRRAFRRYPIVAEVPHPSWEAGEARAVLIDYHLGLVSPDLVLTSGIGYARIGRNDDGEALLRRAEKAGRFADRIFLIAHSTAEAASLRSRMAPESVTPAQPGFDFTRAVA